MRDAYQVAAVRAAEQALMGLVPDGTLMGRAAAGLASVCVALLRAAPGHVYGARVVVLAGRGDNGGDALYAGALLARRGAAVTAIAAGSTVHPGGTAALREAGGRVSSPADVSYADAVPAAHPMAGADLIVDGLLGIGGRGGLREPFASLAAEAERARQAGATVVAVDLPSGIDADTGAVEGPAVRADVTVTFGAIKPGLLIDPGAGHAGTVELVDIGLGPYLETEPAASAPQRDDIRELLPRPGAESDKYRRGVLGLLAGSDRFTGAALLSAGGAVHGGAGMVRVVTTPEAAVLVRQEWPETVVTVHPDERDWDLLGSVGRVQAWVAGPGMGTGPERRRPADRDPAHGPPGPGGRGRADHPEPAPGPAAAPGSDADHAARRRAGPAARHRPGQRGGAAARARSPGGRPAGRHRAAEGLDHGHRVPRRRTSARQPHRHPVAGHRGQRRRAVRAGRRAARAGPGSRPGRPGGRLPARPGGQARGGRTRRRDRAGPDRRLQPGPGAAGRIPEPVMDKDSTAMDREAVIDLGAIAANVAALCELVRGSQVLAAVKADGYGHGMVPAARAALAGGAAWLGVADLDEAVALRRAGITAPVLCMMSFGDPAEAIRHGVDLAAGSAGYVAKVEAAADQTGIRARLHLKADTGLSRGGATPADWPGVVAAALDAQVRGSVRVTGLWSHFACADVPGHPSITAQLASFANAVAVAEKAGVTPEVRHIANTAAALTVPESRYNLVRFGGAVYGLSTLPGGAPSWLRPVMTLRARLAMVKRVPAGTGVSYGHRYVTARETTLGLVPLGYADGVPRGAAGLPLVSARGRRWPIAGTVCMDQFVVDFGDEPAAVGDEVVLFGPGDDGEPTAQEWGEALGTISYDIATGIGARVPRTYPGGDH